MSDLVTPSNESCDVKTIKTNENPRSKHDLSVRDGSNPKNFLVFKSARRIMTKRRELNLQSFALFRHAFLLYSIIIPVGGDVFKVGSLRRVIWAKYAAGLPNTVTYAAEDFFSPGEIFCIIKENFRKFVRKNGKVERNRRKVIYHITRKINI